MYLCSLILVKYLDLKAKVIWLNNMLLYPYCLYLVTEYVVCFVLTHEPYLGERGVQCEVVFIK